VHAPYRERDIDDYINPPPVDDYTIAGVEEYFTKGGQNSLVITVVDEEDNEYQTQVDLDTKEGEIRHESIEWEQVW